MTCGNIGEQTHCQDERFDETTNHFNERHQRQWKFQPPWHSWSIKNIFVIMLRSSCIGYNKRKQCEHCRHCYISRNVRAKREKRYQSQEIVKKYKEKHRQQIRKISLVMLADIRFSDIVAHINNQRFHKSLQTFRRLLASLTIRFSNKQKYDYQ